MSLKPISNSDSNSVKDIFSPEHFKKWSDFLVKEIQNHYESITKAPENPFRQTSRKDLLAQAHDLLKESPQLLLKEGDSKLKEIVRTFFATATQIHSPKTMGHQVSPSFPVTASLEWVSSLFNPSGGIYELGSWGIALERALIQYLGHAIGWAKLDFDGIFTGGGSLANLTAILAARQNLNPLIWNHGQNLHSNTQSPQKLGVIVSKEAHYSIARAAGIIGTGTDQLYKAATDQDRRMTLNDVKTCYEKALRDGVRIFCVVGSACTTPTGAFDHLKEIGQWCRSQKIWFHVDAAHGGGFWFSKSTQSLLKGIEEADTITWDAHKMMYVPSLSTALLYRSKEASFKTFNQDAPYLFAQDTQEASEFDPSVRTLECTRKLIGLSAFGVIAAYGPKGLSEVLDTVVALTQEFYDLLSASEEFEPLHKPQCNILCFRLKDSGLNHSLNHKMIREKILERGKFFITGTILDGQYVLRVTIMNPLTQKQHLVGLMQEILFCADLIKN